MDNSPAAAPVRRKLFASRPSWAKEASCGDTSETSRSDLFGRKHNLEILKKPSQKRDAQQQTQILSGTQHEKSPRRTPKRRRLSVEGSIDSAHSDTESYQHHDEGMWERDRASFNSDEESLYNKKDTSPPTKAVETPELRNARGKVSSHHDFVGVIDLDDSEDELPELQVRQSPDQASIGTRSPPKENALNQESPHRVSEHTSTPDKSVVQNRKERTSSSSPEAWIQQRSAPASQSNPMPDAVVKILIHSQIPNTNPLIIQRKLSQRLKECRVAWCTKQGFDDEQTGEVFLTWRGRRLFDLTTCRSLGISVNEDGDAVIKGQNQPLIAENAQLEMEAITQAILDQNKRLKEEEETARQNEALEAASPQKEKPTGIRIILKAKDYEEYKLIVKPTTKFGQILKTFRKMRKVPEDGTAFLMFDGEKLAEDETMSGSDITDMDTIEVYVK